jgi:hypothetical protein
MDKSKRIFPCDSFLLYWLSRSRTINPTAIPPSAPRFARTFNFKFIDLQITRDVDIGEAAMRRKANQPSKSKNLTNEAFDDTPPLGHEIIKLIVSRFYPTDKTMPTPNVTNLRGEPLVVARLLMENPWEKAALAEIYLREIVGRSKSENACWRGIWKSMSLSAPSVFVESGSTCVYLCELLRRFIQKNRKELQSFPLGTNNHLTAWLFQEYHGHKDANGSTDAMALVPYLYAGQLESKYHGVFPFQRKMSDDHVQEERDGYAQLRLSLAKADVLLLAASRLSLKYGPLVGSRENAIFKHACYSACIPPIAATPNKEIHLFITIQKLVAHENEDGGETNRDVFD